MYNKFISFMPFRWTRLYMLQIYLCFLKKNGKPFILIYIYTSAIDLLLGNNWYGVSFEKGCSFAIAADSLQFFVIRPKNFYSFWGEGGQILTPSPWHSIKAFMCLNKTTNANMCLKIWPKPLCAYNVLKFKNNWK